MSQQYPVKWWIDAVPDKDVKAYLLTQVDKYPDFKPTSFNHLLCVMVSNDEIRKSPSYWDRVINHLAPYWPIPEEQGSWDEVINASWETNYPDLISYLKQHYPPPVKK